VSRLGTVGVDQAGEVAALRAELARMRAFVIDQADHGAEIRMRQQLSAEVGQRRYQEGRSAGYLQAVAEIKRAQHQAVDDLDLYLTRWHVCCGPCRRTGHQPGCTRCQARPRATFGEIHPDDFTGLEAR
jgi:hypothetical protein